MLDTGGLGIEYSREQIDEFEKLTDLFFNENREIYAELLLDSSGRKIYFREWLSGFNFHICDSLDELKIELKKDADHGDLPPGRIKKICDEVSNLFG